VRQNEPPLEVTVAKTKMMVKPASGTSSLKSSLFLIGQNSRGNWVVRDQGGFCGGIFVDRAEAIRFAMFDKGGRPQVSDHGSRCFRARYEP
jgi:hypothetical protein